MSYYRITPEKAKEMLDDKLGAILIDVRTTEEFSQKHIPGATLLPLNDVETKAQSVLPDKNATILVYCRSGVRSRLAALQMVSMGYENVYDFGGILSWPYEVEG